MTQNCQLSEFFDVQRGCRQGDPLSPYIFLCAEVLGIMVRNNKEIKGITIDDSEFLISQYADDTSLILDGSPQSLDASLRTLDRYADMSGLKVNIDKTKVVWIRKKKFSRDKMCGKHGLDWGSSRFTMLGIDFSVNLSEIEDLNYTPKIREIENVLKRWSNQVLSPIGKITIIKSLIISKLNHLFLSIPNPSNDLLKKLNSKLFSFIWDNKPDKVKRDTLSQSHELGGLRMLNIDNYIKGLKLTLIRRMFKNNSKVFNLLSHSEKIEFTELAHVSQIKKLKNPFWNEVFSAWNDLETKNNIDKSEINSVCLWKNDNIRIGNRPIFYKEWANKGIWLINDLLDDKGNILSFQGFQNTFEIRTNFLTYHGLVCAVRKCIT